MRAAPQSQVVGQSDFASLGRLTTFWDVGSKPVRVYLFTTRVSYNHICRGGPKVFLLLWLMKAQVPHAGMREPVELSSACAGRRSSSSFSVACSRRGVRAPALLGVLAPASLGVRALVQLGVHAPATRGVRALDTLGVHAPTLLEVRAPVTQGVRAPATMGVRAPVNDSGGAVPRASRACLEHGPCGRRSTLTRSPCAHRQFGRN